MYVSTVVVWHTELSERLQRISGNLQKCIQRPQTASRDDIAFWLCCKNHLLRSLLPDIQTLRTVPQVGFPASMSASSAVSHSFSESCVRLVPGAGAWFG